MTIKITPITQRNAIFSAFKPKQNANVHTKLYMDPSGFKGNFEQDKKYKRAKLLTFASLAAMTASIIFFVRGKSAAKIKEIYTPNDKIISVEVKKLEETELYKSFSTSGKKIFEFIKSLKNEPAQKIKEFLLAVTAEEKSGNEFIEEITKDPRKSRRIANMLIDRIGGHNNFKHWYYHDQGYFSAYGKYVAQLFKKAKSPEELMQHSPSWALHILNSNKSFANWTIGKIPAEFGNQEEYKALVQLCRNLVSKRNLIGEETQIGSFLVKKLAKAEENKFLVQAKSENSSYEIEFLKWGYSGKIPMRVKAKGNDYVIKIDPEVHIAPPPIPESLTEKERAAIQEGINYVNEFNANNRTSRADSLFCNAKIDWYLCSNGCKNTSRIFYYDPQTESAIYEFIPRVTPEDKLINPIKANNLVRDINNLSVFVNDVKESNFGEVNGVKKLIDVGHSRYRDLLKPEQMNYHSQSPNVAGPDFTDDLISMPTD